MKLTQKVDHFTVFKNFPSTGCCSQKFPPNNLEKISWLDMRGMFSLGGMEWREKVSVQNCGRALVKPKHQPGCGCAGFLMAEMKHNLHCGRLGCQKKQQHWI